jgi:HEAT repeat protein
VVAPLVLGALGVQDAAPELRALVLDGTAFPRLREHAALALRQLAPEAIAELAALLDPETDREVLDILTGPGAGTAEPPVRPPRGQPDPEQARAIILAYDGQTDFSPFPPHQLPDLDPTGETILPALQQWLARDDERWQHQTAAILEALGTPGLPAAPRLRELAAGSPSPIVRLAAGRALTTIDPGSPATRALQIQLLSDTRHPSCSCVDLAVLCRERDPDHPGMRRCLLGLLHDSYLGLCPRHRGQLWWLLTAGAAAAPDPGAPGSGR